MKDKLLIATKTKKTIEYIFTICDNYPHKYIELRKRIINTSFDILENIYISKYFYNIDHDIVKELIRRKIKDKAVLNIIDNIIDSTDADYVNFCINKLKEKEINRINNLKISDKEKNLKIEEINNIFLYLSGKGFPIGNMTS